MLPLARSDYARPMRPRQPRTEATLPASRGAEPRRDRWHGAIAAAVALVAALLIAAPAQAEAATSATARSPYILGIAQIAKGRPIAAGRISAETLAGQPLAIQWDRYLAPRTTQSSGAFALPSAGLPTRFVIVVRGGRVYGRSAKAAFRAIVTRRPDRPQLAHVTLVTTVHVAAYRHILRTQGAAAATLPRARTRALRALGLPAFLRVGFDDRVNPRFVSGTRVHRLARNHGGLAGLIGYLNGLMRQRHVLPAPGLGGGSAQARLIEQEDCGILDVVYEPVILSDCALSLVLETVSLAFESSAEQAEAIAELDAINTSISDLQTEVSNLAAAVNTDFIDLTAANTREDYNLAAQGLGPTTSQIQTYVDQLATLAANVPGEGVPAIIAQQVKQLAIELNPAYPGGVLQPSVATTLANQTVASGNAGLGTVPAAWQALRAEQATGSIGATTTSSDGTVDAALAQGTTLYTNELSSSFLPVAQYWFGWLYQLAILTANYYTYDYAGLGGLTPAQVAQQTGYKLGGFSSSGACPGTTSTPVACAGSIASNLQQQIQAMPMTVPPGTVIDPSTDLIWGTAINTALVGNSSGTGLPTNPTTGNPLAPDLLNQLDNGPCAGCPWTWPNVNPNVTAVVTNQWGGPPTFALDWQLPSINFATGTQGLPPYAPSTSPQFGVPGSGTGLLGSLVGGQQNQWCDLSGITQPPAFPSYASLCGGQWWSTSSNAWSTPPGLGYLPSGTIWLTGGLTAADVEFTQQGQYASTSGAALVVSPVPAQQFGYPAVYPASVLASADQLTNAIQAFQ